MIFLRLLSGILILLLSACNSPENTDLKDNVKPEQTLDSPQEYPCGDLLRPLNPTETPQPSETTLDSYFRLAYNGAVSGDFDTAILNYKKALEQTTCECDRAHAQAGKQAATEAKELLETEGMGSKPTQFFWGRLQELTRSLSCVELI
ncbi:MAG: hypothetical protein QNJ42_23140 [Crocosphaera sp.]|nr:hypothetical protein [Crocosphaera sp.]